MLWTKAVVEAKIILETLRHFGTSQWTAVFIGILILTSFLQSIFILHANRVANEAANAARRTADFLQATERAYVAEQIEDDGNLLDNLLESPADTALNGSPADRKTPEAMLSVLVRFTNYGKTPATLKGWAATLSIDGALRKSESDSKLFPIRILGPGEHTRDLAPRVVGTFKRSTEQSQKLSEGSLQLWFAGNVEFEDIFGSGSKREFVWRYDNSIKRFVPYSFRVVEQS